MSYADNDPYNCERCGAVLPLGRERSAGEYTFLCQPCEREVLNPAPIPVAPAVFVHVQPGFGDMPATAMFNLTEAISGRGRHHPKGSTVTRHSVAEAGYTLPTEEVRKAQDSLLNYMAQRRQIHQKEAA